KINWICVWKVPKLVCGRSLLQVGLPNVYLEAAGLDPYSAHLADSSCSAHEDRNGAVWFQVERMEGRCGNTLKTNITHAVYSNSLFVYPVDGRNGSQPFGIPFSCVYPLETDSSLDVPIIPYSPADHGLLGVGAKASTAMSLYQDSEVQRFVVILEDCYTTEKPSYNDLPRTYLIQNRCPQTQVKVEESGSSLRARFSASLQGEQLYVYMHCSLSLCDKMTSTCTPVCSRRKSRSVSTSIPLKPLTIGPITWVQNLE
ncbi:hypothetical protein UPYG_G00059820, partial [Umbra pygmaea]